MTSFYHYVKELRDDLVKFKDKEVDEYKKEIESLKFKIKDTKESV